MSFLLSLDPLDYLNEFLPWAVPSTTFKNIKILERDKKWFSPIQGSKRAKSLGDGKEKEIH